MINDEVANLFNVRSHNPSFFAVKDSAAYRGELLDFCIPVNLHFPPVELIEMIRSNLPEILRYYPDYADVHQQHIAEMTGLTPETIVPGNGSTEIITLLCREARSPIVTSVPTFSRWTDLPEELNVPLHTIMRKREHGFRLEVDEIVRRVREVGARTLVISNPNNPTGAWLGLEEIKLLVGSLEDLDAVIVDESFIDFGDLETAAAHVARSSNLVVVKSMGKSLGWHGVRLGYAVAGSERAQAQGPWSYYRDANFTEEMILPNAHAMSTERLMYTEHSWHVNHCVYALEAMHRAAILDKWIPEEAASWPHTLHCMMVFRMMGTPPKKLNTRVDMQFLGCVRFEFKN